MSVKVEFDGDVSNLEKSYQALQKSYVALQKQIETIAKNADLFEQSSLKAAKAASKLGEDGKKAVEAYRGEMARLSEQLKANTIDQAAYDRGVTAAKDKLKQQTEAIREQQREQTRLKGLAESVVQGQMSAADRQKTKLKDLEAAWKSGHLTAQQYQQAVKSALEETGGLGDVAGKATGDLKGFAVGLIGGVTTVTAAVAAVLDQIRTAMEEAKQLRREQMGSQLDLATAQGEVVKMMGRAPTAEKTAFIGEVQQIALQAGFSDLPAATQAAADTLSATQTNTELTKSVLRAVLPLQRNKPEQVPEVSGAVADIASLMGVSDETGVQQASALTMTALGQSRLVSPASMKEAAKAVAASASVSDMSSREDRQRAVTEGLAVFAGVSNALKDPGGAFSKTAVAELVTELEQLLPEKDKTVVLGLEERATKESQLADLREKQAKFAAQTGARTPAELAEKAKLEAELFEIEDTLTRGRQGSRGRRVALTDLDRKKLELQRAKAQERVGELAAPATLSAADQAEAAKVDSQIAGLERELRGEVRAGTGLKHLGERLRAVQQSKELQSRFIESASFRGPVTPVMQQLVSDPNSAVAKGVEQALAAVTSDVGAYQEMVSDLERATPQLQLQTQAGAAEATRSQFDVGATAAGRKAQVEKIVDETFLRTRATSVDRIGEYLPFVGERARFSWSMRTGQDPATAAIEALQQRSASLAPSEGMAPETVAERRELQAYLAQQLEVLKKIEATNRQMAVQPAPVGASNVAGTGQQMER